MTRFKRGLALYAEGDLAGALQELRKAKSLAPTYRIEFNIGQVCYEMKDHACALEAYRAYLAGGGGTLPEDRRAVVEADVAKLAERVASILLIVPAGTEIFVDDALVGKAPLAEPILVNAGRRRLGAAAPGSVPVTQVLDLAGGEQRTVHISLGRAMPGQWPTPAQPATPSRWSTRSWMGLGASGVLAGGAISFGIAARSASQQSAAISFAGVHPSPAVRSKHDQALAFAVTSDALTGAAVLAFAGTLVFTFVSKPKTSPAATVGLALSPTGASLQGGF